MRGLVLVLAFIYVDAQYTDDDDKTTAHTTTTKSCEEKLNAELVVLPPMLLGYDGDDDEYSDDDTTTSTTTVSTTKQDSMENFVRKLNKYTLKFEGNLDLPEYLRRKLRTADPRRSGGLDNQQGLGLDNLQIPIGGDMGNLPKGSELGGLENLLRLGLVQSMLQSATGNGNGYPSADGQAPSPESVAVIGPNSV